MYHSQIVYGDTVVYENPALWTLEDMRWLLHIEAGVLSKMFPVLHKIYVEMAEGDDVLPKISPLSSFDDIETNNGMPSSLDEVNRVEGAGRGPRQAEKMERHHASFRRPVRCEGHEGLFRRIQHIRRRADKNVHRHVPLCDRDKKNRIGDVWRCHYPAPDQVLWAGRISANSL